MPIYDYACTVCGRVVEVVHGINGQGPASCETCGGPMKKLMSSPAVHFKGSGWAKKDRSSNGNSTKAAARGAQAGGGAESADVGDTTNRPQGSPEAGDASRDRAKTATDGGKPSSEAGSGAPSPAPTATSSTSDADGA
ncbi:MAG TPA: zinc ribbon domain-containing protein [Candidatus Saccharimonadia bacterium]|nr:zinc ribbon domain-containing protein [Candidatus Saccharimonadia bacterium]